MYKEFRFVISAMHNPKAARRLREGTYFEITCPDCGEFDLVTYRNLYHDEHHKALILAEPPRDQHLDEAKLWLDQMKQTGEYADLA